MANPIFQIRQKLASGRWSEDFPIGSTFDNVYRETSNGGKYTLKNFYDYVMNAFSNIHYIHVGAEEPKSDNVKVWYETPQ